jgi:hypothetical protein
MKHHRERALSRAALSIILAVGCLSLDVSGPAARAVNYSSGRLDKVDRLDKAATVADLNRSVLRDPRGTGLPPMESHGLDATQTDSLRCQTQFQRLPLRFEVNAGQCDPPVRFVARNKQGDLFLTQQEAVLRVFERSTARHDSSRLRPGQPDGPTAGPLDASREPVRSAQIASAVIRLHPERASATSRIVGMDPLPGKTNYFIGNDPAKWRTNVISYSKVMYEALYPGIDLVYYGNEGNLEYDFNVAPGADASRIALSVEGADTIQIDESGELVLQTCVGEVRQHAPRIYQVVSGIRREIAGGYVVRNENEIGFEVAAYDASKELVIDPELIYGTYLGGSGLDEIEGMAVDESGSAYVVGFTQSTDFPNTHGISSVVGNAGGIAFVTKLSPDGSSLVYSTYLGGTGSDFGIGIAVDSTGAAYVTGNTNSTDFPLKNPIQGSPGDPGLLLGDVFVSKLSADGSSLLLSTYLGGNGSDLARGISLDPANDIYVFGYTASNNFPLASPTQASFGGGPSDGFLTVIAPSFTMPFSTYIGGSSDDIASSVAIAPDTGDVYVFGTTDSKELGGQSSTALFEARFRRANTSASQWPRPADSPGPLGPAGMLLVNQGGLGVPQGGVGPFYTPPPSVIDPRSAYLVHRRHHHHRAAVLSDIPGEHRLRQSTAASDAGIVVFEGGGCTQYPAGSSCSGIGAIFSLDLDLNLDGVDNFGGNGALIGQMAPDDQGGLYIAGSTLSKNLQVVNALQNASAGGRDGFIVVLPPDSAQPAFASFLGGSGDDSIFGVALDPQGNIYVAGGTTSANFPAAGHPYQGSFRGAEDGFIAKISAVGPFQVGPDFSLSLADSTITTSRGTRVPVTVDISRLGGLTGSVTVTPPAGAPKGIKIQGGTVSTTGNVAAFRIKVKGNAQVGMYPLVFAGTDKAGQTHAVTLTLVVQ